MAGKKGGLLFGIALGALVGVLFAPGKGKSLRNRIKREIEDGGLGTKALGDEIKTMGRDIVDSAQDVYADPRVHKSVKNGKKNLKRVFADLTRKIKEMSSSPKNRQE